MITRIALAFAALASPAPAWAQDGTAVPEGSLSRLEQTIRERRAASPEESYVASLVARGLPVIARKLGEEAVEAVVAALTDNRDELVGEAADVLFHLLVLLAEKDIALAEVLAELDRREGTSGLDEKTARGA
jgi:phosphoribosyl-ATP pyrophosphohydrolase